MTTQLSEEKKLKANDAIVMMMDAINNEDSGQFYKIADQYASSAARGGEVYWKIKRAIQNRPMTMKRLDDISSNLKSLLIQGQNISDGVYFLNNETKIIIDQLLVEWENKQLFNYHNIKVRHKILLHGPTGNGKTTIARYIAQVANLPFVEVKSEEVIDSHLGSTSGNIFKILNEIQEPCVLFWDEIDSIGGKRGSDVKSSAGHENDRMTNTILTNLDRVTHNTIFVAATNRYDFLDTAFLRRFDIKHEMKSPTNEEKQKFSEVMINHYKINDIISGKIDHQNHGSYSEVKDAVSEIARQYVLSKIKK